MEKALELALKNLDDRLEIVQKLNNNLREKLEIYELVQINSTSKENPYILNLSIKGVKAVDFKNELEKYNVCISIKSACSTLITPSRPVLAITHDKKRAMSSWRISLSHLVLDEEIKEFLEIFDKCYNKLCKEQ
jgi:cysteine desulfurase